MPDELYVPLGDGDLRLEPLAERHREGLRAATAADNEIWAIYPFSYAGEHFDPRFDWLLAGAPQRRSYAVVLEDRIVGMTAWIERGPPAGRWRSAIATSCPNCAAPASMRGSSA